MADHMKTSLVNDAFQMAIQQQKPPRCLLWHTDRGSQYTYSTREQARASIFEYIAVFYNRIRIHSANDYLSLVEFEFQHAKNDSNFSVLKNVA